MAGSGEVSLETVLDRLVHNPRDEGAWANLFKRTWPYVLGLSRDHLLPNFSLDAAEDVAQSVFVRLARLAHFTPSALPRDEDSLRSFLTVTTRNLCTDRWRYMHRRLRDFGRHSRWESLDTVAGDKPTGEAITEARDLFDFIRKRLTPRARQVLDLQLAGLTAAEISERLGVSAKTVYRIQHLIRAVAQIAALGD